MIDQTPFRLNRQPAFLEDLSPTPVAPALWNFDQHDPSYILASQVTSKFGRRSITVPSFDGGKQTLSKSGLMAIQ